MHRWKIFVGRRDISCPSQCRRSLPAMRRAGHHVEHGRRWGRFWLCGVPCRHLRRRTCPVPVQKLSCWKIFVGRWHISCPSQYRRPLLAVRCAGHNIEQGRHWGRFWMCGVSCGHLQRRACPVSVQELHGVYSSFLLLPLLLNLKVLIYPGNSLFTF